MKKLKTKKVEFRVDPYQGAAALATSVIPPKGYRFKEMNRKDTRVVIVFEEMQ